MVAHVGDFEDGGVLVCLLHHLLCAAVFHAALVVSSVTTNAGRSLN